MAMSYANEQRVVDGFTGISIVKSVKEETKDTTLRNYSRKSYHRYHYCPS